MSSKFHLFGISMAILFVILIVLLAVSLYKVISQAEFRVSPNDLRSDQWLQAKR